MWTFLEGVYNNVKLLVSQSPALSVQPMREHGGGVSLREVTYFC